MLCGCTTATGAALRMQPDRASAVSRQTRTARGHTPAQLQQAIAAKLKQGYVREPHVAVEVEAYRPFFILGEVTLPGQYPYVANMTVETAVAIAGGYTPRAQKQRIEVSRQMSGMTGWATCCGTIGASIGCATMG